MVLNFFFILLLKYQLKTNKSNAQNRNKNASNDTSTHFSNNTNSINNSTSLPWKTVQNNNKNSNNSNQTNFTLPSYARLGSGQRSKDDRFVDIGAAGTSFDCRDSVASSISKYRSSISDLGGSSSALVQFTNTRIKSITNRRGAVKYQKLVIF